MTNLTSIAGGAVWMAVSALLTLAALEPVDIQAAGAPVELAQGCETADCAGTNA